MFIKTSIDQAVSLYVDLKDGRSFSNNELKGTYMSLLHRNVKDGSYIIPEYIMDKFIPIVLVEKRLWYYLESKIRL